jgi:heat shock protein HtpX
MSQRFKTFFLLAVLSGMLVGIGAIMGNEWMFVGLGIAILMNGVAYFFSDKLAIRMAKAQPMPRDQYPQIYEMVERLSRQAGQPEPRLYISPSPQLNAFATGRNPKKGVVCVNQGLIDALTRDELEGVIGHELQHVYNRDILVSSVAAVLGAAIVVIARMAFWFGGRARNNPAGAIAGLLMVILAPLAAMIIRAAISRQRESLADRTGAELTGNPMALASALQKLEAGARDPRRQRMGATPAETNEAMAHMYIHAPFGGLGMSKIFSTHPPIPERVKALQEQARRMGHIGPDPYGR